MSDRPHHALVDALAEVIDDPENARRVAIRAGFPRGDLPAFKTARLFWESVVESIVGGKTEGGVDALVAEAAKLYPGNEVFGGERAGAGGETGVDEGDPAAPAAPRFGAVDNRGATIGQQVIVQGGSATFGGTLRPWLRWWPRSRRGRRGLVLLLGGLTLVAAVLLVTPSARRAVCRVPGIRALCLGGPSEAEEALWQRAREVGPSDALKEYIGTYPRGAYVEEARARLDGCRVQQRVEWEDESLPYERPGLPSVQSHATEEDARRAALDRARDDAPNACISYESSSLFRLRSTTFEPERWDCRPRGEGYACTVHGRAVCKVQRRKTVETEICNEARR